jgi:hypothetical protein
MFFETFFVCQRKKELAASRIAASTVLAPETKMTTMTILPASSSTFMGAAASPPMSSSRVNVPGRATAGSASGKDFGGFKHPAVAAAASLLEEL